VQDKVLADDRFRPAEQGQAFAVAAESAPPSGSRKAVMVCGSSL
jgi:hypothetical protein